MRCFGVKTGFDGEGAGAGPVLGLKAGGYWPGNGAMGIANHQSTTLLFDPETGRPAALVGANRLTGPAHRGRPRRSPSATSPGRMPGRWA